MHLSRNGADTLAVAAVVVAPVHVARAEAEAVGVVRVRRPLRRRPVVAVRAGEVEGIAPAVARRGQEDAATVASFEDIAVDAVDRCPL